MADPKITVDNPFNIAGLETLNVAGNAVGVGSENRPFNVGEHPWLKVEGGDEPQQTPAERIAADPELAKYVNDYAQSERSRAITGFKRKAQQEFAANVQKAQGGDPVAQQAILDHVYGQFAAQATAQASAARLYQEFQDVSRAYAGDDQALAQALDPRNFDNWLDYTKALANVEVQRAQAAHAAELERLSEAKAVDMLASKRQSMANVTDLQRGGTTTPARREGSWKTLADAATQWNSGEITLEEYVEARRLHAAGQLPTGELGL
jgi:hypothetical protein